MRGENVVLSEYRSILYSPCRSCRDGHALSYVGEKKGQKDSPFGGSFDSPPYVLLDSKSHKICLSSLRYASPKLKDKIVKIL